MKPGDIMTAVRNFDYNFHLMRNVLALPVQWDLAEVVQALRFIIESFNAGPLEKPLLALPAPPAKPVNGEPVDDEEMVNGDTGTHLEIESESKAAEKELDFVMNALTSGLEVRSDSLQLIIMRLHAFPAHVLTTTMRSMMAHGEIVFFINILRIELADGGMDIYVRRCWRR